MFRRLFAEGAFAAAFIPIFSSILEQEGREKARELAEQAFAVLFVILVLFVTLLTACGQKGPLFLPGEPEQLAQHTAIAAEYSAKDLMVD